MRALLAVIIIAAGLWSGYWFVGKSAVESGVEATIAAAPANGVQIGYQDYGVSGFPNRFDLTFTAPSVRLNATDFAWNAEFFQLLSLSYKPWHLIAAFAPVQHFEIAGQPYSLTSGKLQASLIAQPKTDLPLDHATLIGDTLIFKAQDRPLFTAQTLRLASRIDPSRVNSHQIGLEILDITPAEGLWQLPQGLPNHIPLIRTDATASFSAPLDRFFGQTQPMLTALDIRETIVQWGDLNLFAKGALTVIDGYPEGELALQVKGWQSLLPILVDAGVIKPDQSRLIETMAKMLARGSADGQSLSLPLTFRDGRMALGPIPLGPAPRLTR